MHCFESMALGQIRTVMVDFHPRGSGYNLLIDSLNRGDECDALETTKSSPA